MKIKDYQDLTFTDDFMFCKVLSDNPDLAKKLAEIITDRKIKSIDFPKDQYVLRGSYEGKGVCFDVYFADDTNTKYDLEMQTTRQTNLPRRSRYYQSLIDQSTLEHGADYSKLPNSYVIFICVRDPFESGLAKYSFENICKENGNPLNDGAYKIFINAKSPKADTPLLQELVEYLKSGKVSGGISEEIDAAVSLAKRDRKGAQMFYTLEDKIRETSEEARMEGLMEGRIETTIKMGLRHNLTPEQIVLDLVEDCDLDTDVAIKAIEEYQKQNNEQ